MDLTLSDEQMMLRESVARFVRDSDSAAARDPAALWGKFAELGWLALPLPEDHGGLGGSVLDATLLLEEFGRGLLSTPYVGTVILGAELLRLLGNDAQQAAILPDVAAGEHRIALAHEEAGPRGGGETISTKAVRADGGWRLTGTKIAVVDGIGADTLLVSADVEGRAALFLVGSDTAGLSFVGYPMPGGGQAATVTFDDITLVPEARLGDEGIVEAIEAATDNAIVAHCAEAVGIMAALLEATVTYSNTREQFGKPLTANQAVRFKLADMAVALEEARSLALRAALMLAAPSAERIRAVAGAKAGIGRGARRAAELAIQLHGAMGVTEELTIGAYYKRVLALDAMFGGVEKQLVRHARASGRLAPAQKVAA